jgi:PAS domain S-box-containing protein
VLHLTAGVLSSVVVAGGSARAASESSRQSLANAAAEIAASIGLSVQREADLTINAGAVIAENPGISNADFTRWAASVRALDRFPEVDGFGEVVLVPQDRLGIYASLAVLDPAGPLGPQGSFQVVPPGSRALYCFARLSVNRPQAAIPAGFDFCADSVGSILQRNLAARDDGSQSYEPHQLNGFVYLGVETPIYRGGAVPATVEARRQAFVGWLGMSIDPQVILRRALAGHPDLAVTLRFDDGRSRFAFASGPAGAGTTAHTVPLGDGWTAVISGRVQAASVFATGSSRLLLGAGIALSLLLTTLFLTLASSRARALTLVHRRTIALRNSEERFRALVQHSSDLTLVADREGVLSWVSPASLTFLGMSHEELVSRSVVDIAWPDDRTALERSYGQALQQQVPVRLECRFNHADGSFRWAEATLVNLMDTPAVGAIVLNLRDVTERNQLQIDLRHAQKLEAVGQLASGVAHEINTPLQYVGTNLRFLAGSITDVLLTDGVREGDPDAAELVTEIPAAIRESIAGIDRVSTIFQAMRTFGHRDGSRPVAADLNEALRATLVVARAEYERVADVTTDLAELPAVTCYPSELSQVFLNLIVNAAHAIAERVGDTGQRGLITARTWLDDGQACICIADTGTGMPPEVAEHIFEPFFTTKEVGQGTGQGLSIAYATVVTRHAGSIDVRTAPAQGTTITVRIPVAGPPERGEGPTA